jgi:hypothetical protein
MEFVPALFAIILWLAIIVLYVFGWCKIVKRLGYDSYAGFVMVIPIVNFFAFLYWAITESPNERTIRKLQSSQFATRDDDAEGFLTAMGDPDVTRPPENP